MPKTLTIKLDTELPIIFKNMGKERIALPTDLVRRAEKQVRKAVKNRTLFERSEFGRFQPFSRKFFERDGRSLDLFCLLFCVKAKRVSGFKGNAL